MAEDRLPMSSIIESTFERTSRFFDQHPVFSKELVSAKETFFSITGKIGETDNEFGNRMNAFLLWFLFDWQLSSTMTTPVDHYLAHLEKSGLNDDFAILQAQKNHIHSLFYFVKERRDQTIIKDVFSGQKYTISDSRILIGQEKDAIFETRIFELDGAHYFANYFVYHPVIVRKEIKRSLKLIKKKKSPLKPFLMQLHSYHTKWHRYRNINIKSIYHFDKSIPEAK